jgi:hypothetical protein
MTELPHNPEETSSGLETRLSTLESIFKLDDRLKSIESTLASKGVTANIVPWWRNGKTVVILGALLTATVPLVSAVNGIFQNRKDSQRLLIEQQDKIRQTYLDRVLKPGLTEGEQQRLFGLLSRLTGDPELQEWAREELAKTIEKIEELRKEKSSLEEHNKSLEIQLAAEKASNKSALERLGNEVIQTRQKLTNVQRRIGESGVGSTVSCTTPDGSASASITCALGQTAICYAPAGGDAFAECVPITQRKP